MVQKPPSKLEEFADYMAHTPQPKWGAEKMLKDGLRMEFLLGPKFYPNRAEELQAQARERARLFNLGILDDGTIYDLPDPPIVE